MTKKNFLRKGNPHGIFVKTFLKKKEEKYKHQLNPNKFYINEGIMK